MSFSFENQVALVTGAASGIGWATANAFAQLCDRAIHFCGRRFHHALTSELRHARL